MIVQQYLPEILDMVEAASTEAICQQVGLCSVGEATKRNAASAASVLRNNDDSTFAAQEDLLESGCAAYVAYMLHTSFNADCLHATHRYLAYCMQIHHVLCRDGQAEAQEALKSAHLEGTECQICHAVASYVRAALANDETKKEIELVCASPPRFPSYLNGRWCHSAV